jgi:hypothetical protein
MSKHPISRALLIPALAATVLASVAGCSTISDWFSSTPAAVPAAPASVVVPPAAPAVAKDVAPASAKPMESAATAAATERASVYFISPFDGATVTSPVKVQFGLKGMALKNAGEVATGTGHHHLLINKPAIAKGAGIPADSQHIHFGKGQTETEVTLPPGTHVLRLQFADGYHASYGPEMSAAITVTVK